MTMQVTVEGEDITPEECMESGWTTTLYNRKSQREPGVSGRESLTQRSSGRGGSRTPAASVKKRLATASRLPHLPREHFRIIVRPRGGMDVKKISQIKVTQALATAAQLNPAETEGDIVCVNVVQNIFVVSTPTEKNARAYARVEDLLVETSRYKVNAYLAAPDNTCKGIVRGVDLDFDHNRLRDMIVQPRNPKVLEVKRIKNTTTIIVLFDGLKVPNYVMCGASLLRCTLYRRQTDVCYACGRLGHRADVCPAPEKTVCRGCGTASPAEDHECSPKCSLCGGPHLTADKACKQRFLVPYVVRRRRRQRKRAKGTSQPQTTLSSQGNDPSVPSASARRRSATPGGHRSRSSGRSRSKGRSPSRGRSCSRVRIKESMETTWADRAKQKPPKVTKGSPPEQSNFRIAHLEQENALLRAALEQLRAQFESFRQSCSSTPPASAPRELPADAQARSAKKRALVASVQEEERDFEEFKSEVTNSMRDVRESVNSLQGAVMTLVETVHALTNRVNTLENKVGPGAAHPGFSGAVKSSLPLEFEGSKRGTPYDRPSTSSKHGGSG